MFVCSMILHADADAFFVAVEQRDDPALRGRPVVVGGGVVVCASYEARVRGGMGGRRARRLCPELVVVRPRFEAYVAAGRDLLDLCRAAADRVEPGSLEEAFLDLGDVAPDEAREVAGWLRRAARERVGLAVTVGGATTKVVAKVASRTAKPDGLLMVAPGDELRFLRPLPVDRVWGIGPATAAKLRAHGIATVGDAERFDEPALMGIVGKAAGRYVHAVAHNRHVRRVRTRRSRRSVGSQRALGRTERTPAELEEAVEELAARIGGRMRKGGRAGRTVTLRLRFGDYTRATRSRTLACAVDADEAIAHVSLGLLDAAMPTVARRGLTLVGLTVSNLERRPTAQLALPLAEASRPATLDLKST
jgi:DNA polymerase IV